MTATYRITHRTEYRYAAPVSSSYGQLHLLPRELPRQRCRRAEVKVALTSLATASATSRCTSRTGSWP
jgi:transglutaminase-like putative cysteine protease